MSLSQRRDKLASSQRQLRSSGTPSQHEPRVAHTQRTARPADEAIEKSNERRQMVYQFMASKGCVKASEFEEFLNSLREDDASQLDEQRVIETVGKLNNVLTKFNMRIRSTTDDKTHERYYSLISTIDNSITRQASHYTPKEFDYFRLIWQTLQDGECEMSEIKRLGTQNKVLNHKLLVQEWHDKHWLVIEDDTVRLGPRSKAELDVLSLPPTEPRASMASRASADDSR